MKMDFNFDTWAKLAKDDPAEFERQRAATLRAAIVSAPSEYRRRLEGLQFRLNLERQRSSTALGSCVRLNSLMWAGFHRLRNELTRARGGESASTDSIAKPSAEVIPMRARPRPAPPESPQS